MTAQNPIPPATPRSGVFADPVDDRYQAALRYLSACAHEQTTTHPHAAPRPHGPKFVRDVMVADVVTAYAGAAFKEIVAALARNRIGAVPVVDEDHKVIGMVSESDLLARVTGGRLPRPRGHLLAARAERHAKIHGLTARELMTAPAVVTTPDALIADAARLAAARRVRRLPVVDRAGKLVGIVARGELLRPYLRDDAEIRDDVVKDVISGTFVLDPNSIDVSVREGVVALKGQVERKSVLLSLVHTVPTVCGVVDVDHSALTYAVDDTVVATSMRPKY